MMKVAYITIQAPWANAGETFVVTEIQTAVSLKLDITVIPIRPVMKGHVSSDGSTLRDLSIRSGLFNISYARDLARWIFRHPLRSASCLYQILRFSGGLNQFIRNTIVVPKAFHVASLLQKTNIDHIHAHWLSTPSTVAFIGSTLLDIPWSITAHRGDIGKRNLLVPKLKSSSFVRVISENGIAELQSYVRSPLCSAKIRLLHMGVTVPESPSWQPPGESEALQIAVPANLIPVKGHKFLIEALAALQHSGKGNFQCHIFGDGPLRLRLERQSSLLGVSDKIIFHGRVPHADLLARMQSGSIHLVVLPSLSISPIEREGIPVALMEAMAHGIPVVSTNSGGIPELISGAGDLVPPSDSQALAAAIQRNIDEPDKMRNSSNLCRRRIIAQFDVRQIVQTLMEWIDESAAN